MQTGMTPETLQATLTEEYDTRKDFVAPVAKLTFAQEKGALAIAGLPGGSRVVNQWTEGQIVSHFGIPTPYWRKMYSAGSLGLYNLNTWAKHPDYAQQKRLIRTVGPTARAFLSDAYRCLNNIDLASAALPILAEKGAVVRSASVTETRLYIKATLPKMEMKVTKSRQKGDVLRGGIVLKNSEVGNGALDVALFIERLICVNGMIGESLFRKTHLGKRIGADFEQATELFTDKTKRLDDAAFWSKLRDVLVGTLNQGFLEGVVDKANIAAGDQIPDPTEIEAVIVDVTNRYALPEGTRPNIMKHFIEGADLSRWGLLNAVTRTADDVKDYEIATALEEAGGKILDLSSSEWKQIAA